MNVTETLIFLFVLYLYYGVLALKFVKGAGYSTWQALTPFYNIYIMTKVIDRPWWFVILAILPVVGNIVMIVIFYELLHVYRIANTKNTVLGVISLGLYFGYLGFSTKLKYEGRNKDEIRKHIGEGFSSIIFAIVAATLIRAFTFEAFVIPTPSMEKSLLVGDFLFVSKLQYGSRLPMTPFSLPLMHNKVPFTNIKAFSDFVQFPYLRFPKITKVERNDAVVFNYPMEDQYPIDKREHYVKRCVALPGDTLQIIDREIFINGALSILPDLADRQFQYYVRTNNTPLSAKMIKDRFDINMLSSSDQQSRKEEGAASLYNYGPGFNEYIVTISDSQIEEFQAMPNITRVEVINSEINFDDYPKDLPPSLFDLYHKYEPLLVNNSTFPNPANSRDVLFKWTRDNYGPIVLPKEGGTVELTVNNIYLYRRIIEVYEGNTLKQEGRKFFLNDAEITHYTFEQDYYWMMGDNRHNSLDSRYWGFVPADHIVGKPVFIWMSFDKYARSFSEKIRTDRIFSLAGGNGERRSYFFPFIVLIAIGYGVNYWWKKKKST
jgi:signal peptidase I